MNLSREILAHYLAQENAEILFPSLQINAEEIIELQCYQTLQKIQKIIQNGQLDDEECFTRIEEIVCAFEDIGVDCGSRHDF